MVRAAVLLALLLASSCSSKPVPPPERDRTPAPVGVEPEPWSDEWLLREGLRFTADTRYRRAALERSLTNHDNVYSRVRLASYGHGTRGWDMLPVWTPRSRPVTADLAEQLQRGEMPEVARTHPPLWDGVEPTTMHGWVELGRRVFFEFPMRAEVFMEHGLTKPELAAAVGVERTAAGDVPGLVVFANVDGETRVGITCAICHSTVKNGVTVAGSARRRFDYGRLRLAYYADTGDRVDPALARRMAGWGPGRADVTEDDDEDPVTIPDLWGLRAQRWLTQAGTIRHDSPLALAIRQETQLTDSNHALIRPPRALAWALAMYVYSLSPPPSDAVPSALTSRGSAVFSDRCAGCHSNAAFGGRTIAASAIGTNPSLATGRGRGTGSYRVPPLVRVGEGAPYLHDGSVGSLDELLSAARLDPAYVKGHLGPGPIPGHRAGTDLAPADRAALIAYLGTL
ncbi:MAG: c-type cytochrome [Deltaproteobacteria bacterium]|nr:c-type cytochrome [Deltaproteobacteria bacterium]